MEGGKAKKEGHFWSKVENKKSKEEKNWLSVRTKFQGQKRKEGC